MSEKNPIKIIAFISVIIVFVVIGVVGFHRISESNKNEFDDVVGLDNFTTLRGSNSGQLSSNDDEIVETEISSTTNLIFEEAMESTDNTEIKPNNDLTMVPSTTLKHTTVNATTTIKSDPIISYLQVVSKPSKIEYYIGESFSSSGLRVNAVYTDGTTRDVSSFVILSGYDLNKSGTQSVKVRFYDGLKTLESSFSIKVKSPSISLSFDQVDLTVGQYTFLSVQTTPSDIEVNWSSSDSSIVTVTSSGKVTAVSEGFAIITANIYYCGSSYSETCIVSVSSVQPETSEITVVFEDGTYDNDEYTIIIYDLEGYISSNYSLEYIEIGLIGPVYINGTIQDIEQSKYYDDVADIGVKYLSFSDLGEYYGNEYEFDIIAGEEYTVYIYAEDSAGGMGYAYLDFAVDAE